MAAAVAIVLAGRSASADSPTSQAPISTDRPSVTDSSLVVPRGFVQAENGLGLSEIQAKRVVDFPQTLARVGLTAHLEARFAAPDVVDQYGPSASSGVGDLAFGLKYQLGPIHGFDASLIVSLSAPTGAATVTSGGYDPSLQLAWSRALTPNWTLAGMISLYVPTLDRRRNTTGEVTVLIDRQLTARWDGFVEYACDTRELTGGRQLFHVGASFKMRPAQQFDLHVGAGLTAATANYVVGVGYSFRVRAFRR